MAKTGRIRLLVLDSEPTLRKAALDDVAYIGVSCSQPLCLSVCEEAMVRGKVHIFSLNTDKPEGR